LAATGEVEEEEEATLGLRLQVLPKELLEDVLFFLDEDSLDRAKMANTKWRDLLRSERVWRAVCVRTFCAPVYTPIRCAVNTAGASVPRRFGSWLTARTLRPHVRTDTGLYVMRHIYIKNTGPPSMWTEEYTPFCEVRHFRYFLFLPNGELFYASTPLGLPQMRPKFIRRLREEYHERGKISLLAETGESDHSGAAQPDAQPLSLRQRARLQNQRKKLDTLKADTIYKGCYTIKAGLLTAVLNMVNYSVTFTLECEPGSGRHSSLYTIRHQSLYHKEGEDIIDYKLSSFRRDRVFEYYPFIGPHDLHEP